MLCWFPPPLLLPPVRSPKSSISRLSSKTERENGAQNGPRGKGGGERDGGEEDENRSLNICWEEEEEEEGRKEGMLHNMGGNICLPHIFFLYRVESV